MRAVYLFAEMDDKDLDDLVQHTRRISLEKGQWLFAQGQPAEHFYLVQEGQILLFRQSIGGDEMILDIIHPGGTFAEGVVYLNEARYPVNARALNDCKLLAFDSQRFRAVLGECVGLCLKLLARLHRRIDHLMNDMESLVFQTATQRFIAHLLQQAAEPAIPPCIRLEIPKQTLAARLSVTPETLSRILIQLQNRGLIQVEGRTITLLKPDELRAELRLY